MRSPEVSIRIAFCSSVSLCGTNQEQIFHLSKSSRTMVCAVSLLMHNSSAINLSVSRRSWASIYHTFWIISGVLFVVDGRPELDSSSVVPSLRESIWTISKPIFCSRLPSRTHAPTFLASPLQFSPICNRPWCLDVASLRCDSTSQTDYVQLAAVGLHCLSHAVHAVSRISPCVWRTMRMRNTCAKLPFRWHHSPNLLDTPCML